MSDALPARPESPPRLERIGAVGVNLAPALSPALIFAAVWLGGGRGWQALALSYVLACWAGFGCALVLLANTWLLLRRRQTLGLAYFDLAVQAPASLRLLAAELAVLTVPSLLGLLASTLAVSIENDLELQVAVFVLVVSACYGFDVWTWSGPDGRGLGDRLGAARVVRLPQRAGGRWWADVALVAPPLVVSWAYLDVRGAAFGGGLAALSMAGLVVLNYRRK